MRVSTLRMAGHARKQLIQFIGKRSHPATPAERHAHPAAPSDIAATFTKFLEKSQLEPQVVKPPAGSSNTPGQSGVFAEAWEAPSRFWRSRLPIEEREIEAVLSGGATLRA